MLLCADGTVYSGYASDPEQRAAVHNSGRARNIPRSRLPVELVFRDVSHEKRGVENARRRLRSSATHEKFLLISTALRSLRGFLCIKEKENAITARELREGETCIIQGFGQSMTPILNPDSA
jgi:putative endonuclease